MPEAAPVSRAAREALLAQLFADLDALLRRVEDLPELFDAAGLRMDKATTAIAQDCDRLAALTVDLQRATREDLSALLRRRADEAAAVAAAHAADQIREVIASAIGESLTLHVAQLSAVVAQERLRDRARWRLAITAMGLFTTTTLLFSAWLVLAR